MTYLENVHFLRHVYVSVKEVITYVWENGIKIFFHKCRIQMVCMQLQIGNQFRHLTILPSFYWLLMIDEEQFIASDNEKEEGKVYININNNASTFIWHVK